MELSANQFAVRYAAMSETELMELAHEYDSLTELAQAALREEFARRHLEPPLIEEEEPEGGMLVTIRQYRDLSEAIVARSMLQSNGIAVYLKDENLARLEWQVTNGIGGIRLQVEAADEAAATDLLDQPVQPRFELGEGDEFVQPNCPACGSAEITFEGASRAAALPSLLLLGVPLPTGAETWSCSSCGARWEDTEA